MVYETMDRRQILLSCNCTCGDGMEFIFDEGCQGEPSCVFLELVEHKGGLTRWGRLKDGLKKVWNGLRGRPICMTELLLTKEQLTRFRICIQRVEEIMEEVDGRASNGTHPEAE